MTKKKTSLILAVVCISLAALALAILIAVNVNGQDRPPAAFRLLQGGVVMGNGIDLGLSHVAVNVLGATEYNPVGSWIIRRPVAAVAYMGVMSLGFTWATDELWRVNKTLAWIVAGASFALKAWAIYHNFRSLERR
jgi:hypothetical protein